MEKWSKKRIFLLAIDRWKKTVSAADAKRKWANGKKTKSDYRKVLLIPPKYLGLKSDVLSEREDLSLNWPTLPCCECGLGDSPSGAP